MYTTKGEYSFDQFPKPHQTGNVYLGTRGIAPVIDYTSQRDWLQPKITTDTLWILPTLNIEYVVKNLFRTYTSATEKANKTTLIPEEIAQYISNELQLKASNDDYLREVLLKSIEEIKKYLDSTGKKYELEAILWRDVEVDNWEENVIKVKIECKNNKEKRKIWDDIDRIVGQYEDEGVVILTNVEKYEFQ